MTLLQVQAAPIILCAYHPIMQQVVKGSDNLPFIATTPEALVETLNEWEPGTYHQLAGKNAHGNLTVAYGGTMAGTGGEVPGTWFLEVRPYCKATYLALYGGAYDG